ncbi:hypothetical protein [Pseudorhodoplanes sinuspersici]|uniref:Uncharacterized protein n=1 Tax=Pseudorhodoplanes sinuspersici TaxID=1235591 RepID=A0A1W6ZW83_9HYPH|nr:hypothetical protein [Pseudorhodoplanes sinuspersici]ARQ01570.1 hypothetical protein CAK95_22500 [Pseudorhodoplanes sinuspersici]RKE73277.1 hypothetical protein DFP91_1157 [Pseudorhodoplanes sinuspersici]
MDSAFPTWLRLIVAVSAVMQLGFGLTLMIDPAQIGTIWPWSMPPLTTRILGASTLVSVPLALLSVGINRFSYAAIPFVMMATYRLLQLAAGAMHLDRFGTNIPMTINYFGGGALMLMVLSYGLWTGWRRHLTGDADISEPMVWPMPAPLRASLALVGILFMALGLVFFFDASEAAIIWFDAKGITPLTARLFSSPLMGLGLGLILLSRTRDWRMAAIPAVGFCTMGFVVLLAFILGYSDFAPRTWMAWIVASTPAMLLAAGFIILALKPVKLRQPA